MIRFSVIIPVYNAAHTIERCVESIENNTYKNFEIILIEDGSSDESWEKCIELSERFDNIRIICNEENRGVSHTRNRGLKIASGEYTMFVDSDDWIDEHYYEKFEQIIEQYHPLFAICGYVNHDEKQNGRSDEFKWKNFEGDKVILLKNNLKELYDNCLIQQLWNKLFLTEVIQKNQILFDENISIGEDFRFILEYLKVSNVENAILINKPLYHYMRDQMGSLMYHVGYESIEEPLKNLYCLYKLLGMNEESIEKALACDRKKQMELYAYLIMHNAGMKMQEKRKLIFQLDLEHGKELYRKNKMLFIKEKLSKWIRRSR